MKNSKMLITTGVVLTSLLLNVASPVLACTDTIPAGMYDPQSDRDRVQEGILYQLKLLNI
jgi:hypothetical protein